MDINRADLIEFQITSLPCSAKAGQIFSLDTGSCVSLVTAAPACLNATSRTAPSAVFVCLYIIKISCGQCV